MNMFHNTVVAVFLAVLMTGIAFPRDQDQTKSSAESEPTVTRVLYLKGMTAREAVTMLRTQIQVRQIATIRDQDFVIVADTLDRVERSEKLLRQQGAISGVAEPHPPLNLNSSAGTALETRTFQVGPGESGSVVTILRAIYQMREVTEKAETNSISVRSSTPLLDAGEALLRELELLAGS